MHVRLMLNGPFDCIFSFLFLVKQGTLSLPSSLAVQEKSLQEFVFLPVFVTAIFAFLFFNISFFLFFP